MDLFLFRVRRTLRSCEGSVRLRHAITGLVLGTSGSQIKLMTEAEVKANKEASLWTITHGE